MEILKGISMRDIKEDTSCLDYGSDVPLETYGSFSKLGSPLCAPKY